MTEEQDVVTGGTTVIYLAFDPGVSTGWAGFDKSGEVISKGICRGLDALDDFLYEYADRPPEVVIYESYRIFGHKAKAHIGSQVETAQAIGKITTYARRWKSKVIPQPSSILTIAQLWSGVKLPSNHDRSHDIAAYNHGVYYLQSNHIRKSRLLK